MAKFIEVHNIEHHQRVLINLDQLQGVSEHDGKCIIFFQQRPNDFCMDVRRCIASESYDHVREMIASATGGIPMQPDDGWR